MEEALQFIDAADSHFEAKLLGESCSVENVLEYLQHKESTNASADSVVLLLQRATQKLPRSYKLWMLYLRYRMQMVNSKRTDVNLQREYAVVNSIFIRAMPYMDKYPVFWKEYLGFLSKQVPLTDLTSVRRAFNACLQALPLTQHGQIWPLFLQFADRAEGRTAWSIWHRFFIYKRAVPISNADRDTSDISLVLSKLVLYDSDGEFLLQMRDVFHVYMHNTQVRAMAGMSELEVWQMYMEYQVSSSRKSNAMNDTVVVRFVADAVAKFPDQMGKFTVQLSRYWIAKSRPDKARANFQKGIDDCLTIRDFTLIFDALTEFEDSMMTKLVAKIEKLEEENSESETLNYLNDELNFLFARFEELMARRPFLVNDVLLRQNINNVDAWLERASLYNKSADAVKLVEMYNRAIESIDPAKVEPGKFGKLWLEFANLYIEQGQLSRAREVFQTATKVPFKTVDELVNIWTAWTEAEAGENDIHQAIDVISVALEPPKQNLGRVIRIDDETLPPQTRVHKSINLWSLYLDLVEATASPEDTVKAYERVLELKVATPLTLVNYANFLEELGDYEACFKVYERGVSLFSFPTAFEIWNIYLAKVINHQQHTGLSTERIRDLFDQALAKCPADLSKPIYLMYAKFEEDNGLATASMKIYKRALAVTSDADVKLSLYKIYSAKALELLGAAYARPVYEEAFQEVPVWTPGFAEAVIVAFASLEAEQKQYTRAREIFRQGAESVSLATRKLKNNPERELIWAKWKEFELEYGNEETYKQMLRFKRQVEEKMGRSVTELLERTQLANNPPMGFVAASDGPKVSSINAGEKATEQPANPDAIELDLDDLDD